MNDLIIIALLWVLVIVTHELGHYIGMWYFLKRKPKGLCYWEDGDICIGNEAEFESLLINHRLMTLSFGIVAGILPLLFMTAFLHSLFWQLANVGFYIIGCQYDINCIVKLLKQKKKKCGCGIVACKKHSKELAEFDEELTELERYD